MKRPLISRPGFHIAALIACSIALHLNQPWKGGLAGWDDAFYSACALDMVDAGDLITPRYNGDPTFYTAPPMFFWLLALSFKVWGATTYAAKFTGGISTVLAVIVIFFVARRLWGNLPGAALSAAFLMIDPFFLKYGHKALMHTAWACTVAIALYGLYRAAGATGPAESRSAAVGDEGKGNPLWYLVFSVFSAGSILFKSAAGVYPILIGAVWMWWAGKLKTRHGAYFGLACALGLLLGGAWFWVEYIRYGDQFVDEHIRMMLFQYSGISLTSCLNPLRFFGFLPSMLRADLLGSVLLPFGLWSIWKERSSDEAKLVLVWILVPIGCMALMNRHDPKYMAPVFPGIALAVGHFLNRVMGKTAKERLLPAVYGAGILWAFLSLAVPIRTGRDFLRDVNPLLEEIKHSVPPDGRWLLLVSDDIPIDPKWPNRFLLSYVQPRGVVNQILFYARRRFRVIHKSDLRKLQGKGPYHVFAYRKDIPGPLDSMTPGPLRLSVKTKGPDWVLFAAERNP